jgi:phosphotransferase system enzyme I (PtsP)
MVETVSPSRGKLKKDETHAVRSKKTLADDPAETISWEPPSMSDTSDQPVARPAPKTGADDPPPCSGDDGAPLPSDSSGHAPSPPSEIFRGTGVGHGLVVGVSRLLKRKSAASILERFRRHGGGVPADEAAFDALVARTTALIEAGRKELGERLPEAASLLVDSHLTMLSDPLFRDHVIDELRKDGNLARAIAESAVAVIRFFESSPHEFMREKARDVEDIALRLLSNFDPAGCSVERRNGGADIIVARELLPSDITMIALCNIRAILLTSGGLTAHVSLLVRSFGIPLVIVNAPELLDMPDGTPLIVDGMEGTVHVNPPEATLRNVEKRIAGAGRLAVQSRPHAGADTRDGIHVQLQANINLLGEVSRALEAKMEGIGLYRTELLFLMRKDLPGEEDQVRIYRGLLNRMGSLPVVFRTLDAGGDKMLPFFDDPPEANPALGLRSTRFTLRHPEIFDAQLRAILRAAGNSETVSVMFPMIGSLDEWRQARARFDECAGQVEKETGVRNRIRVGMMVELPAVADLAAEFAAECDFFSIGTNDFIQYMLGVDRTNENVASYYCPHHPSVLRALKRIVDAAVHAGIPASVCGEMAHDPRYIPFFLGIGVRSLSTDPTYLPDVQKTVETLDISETCAYAAALLAESTIAGVESKLV